MLTEKTLKNTNLYPHIISTFPANPILPLPFNMERTESTFFSMSSICRLFQESLRSLSDVISYFVGRKVFLPESLIPDLEKRPGIPHPRNWFLQDAHHRPCRLNYNCSVSMRECHYLCQKHL